MGRNVPGNFANVAERNKGKIVRMGVKGLSSGFDCSSRTESLAQGKKRTLGPRYSLNPLVQVLKPNTKLGKCNSIDYLELR